MQSKPYGLSYITHLRKKFQIKSKPVQCHFVKWIFVRWILINPAGFI